MVEKARLVTTLLLICVICHAQTVFGAETSVDIDRLADAIYRAEGGAKTRHPYGILAKYKTTTPRQACINTIKSGLKRYAVYKGNDDFITFLGRTYCPTTGNKLTNDEKRLNIHWVKNVQYYYAKGSSNGMSNKAMQK